MPFQLLGRSCFTGPRPSARWKRMISCVDWTFPVPQCNGHSLLCESEQKRDFSRPIAKRATEILGPGIALRRFFPPSAVQVVTRAPVCPLGLFGSCAMVCVHRDVPMLTTTTKVAQTRVPRRAGLPSPLQPMSLASILVNFRDLITHTVCLGVQHGIVLLGFVDAFVYAHNRHRHNKDDPTYFENIMEERTRMMTALTLAYAHAFQQFVSSKTSLRHKAFENIKINKQTPGSQGQSLVPTNFSHNYAPTW